MQLVIVLFLIEGKMKQETTTNVNQFIPFFTVTYAILGRRDSLYLFCILIYSGQTMVMLSTAAAASGRHS